jgi:hypothetical protein
LTNSLDIEGDETDDLVETFQGAFGLEPRYWANPGFQTVGDLESLLWSRFADGEDDDGACMTTMAFLRLRAAISSDQRLRPASLLAPLAGSHPRNFRRELEAATDFDLPPLEVTAKGTFAAILAFLALPAGLIANAVLNDGIGMLIALAALPLMILIVWIDRNSVPASLATLGDLARQTVPLNYAKLASKGGRVRRERLWDAITALLAETLERDAADIDRDTRLFATIH